MKEFVNRGIGKRSLADYKKEANMLDAAECGDVNTLKSLIEANKSEIWRTDEVSYFNPLHFAANKGHVKAAILLLDAEPSIVNRKSKSGESPLHLAAMKGHEDMVKLLLMRGADTTLTNFRKNGAYTERLTPREVAEENKFENIVKIFDNWEKYKVKRDAETKELEEFTAKMDQEKSEFKTAQRNERKKLKAETTEAELVAKLEALTLEQTERLEERTKDWNARLLEFYQARKTLKTPQELLPPAEEGAEGDGEGSKTEEKQ